MDLAEFSIIYNYPAAIEFIGYRADGSTVATMFTTDGIIDGTGPLADFQTFYFGQEFSDIVRFEAPGNTYAMDNLVFFDVVPEPTSLALLLVGGVTLWFLRSRQNCKARSSHVFEINGSGVTTKLLDSDAVTGLVHHNYNSPLLGR